MTGYLYRLWINGNEQATFDTFTDAKKYAISWLYPNDIASILKYRNNKAMPKLIAGRSLVMQKNGKVKDYGWE